MLFFMIGDGVLEDRGCCFGAFMVVETYPPKHHALCCFGACPMLFWSMPYAVLVHSSVGDGGFLSRGWCIPQLGMVHSSVGDAGFLSWGCWIPTFHDLRNVFNARLTHLNVSVRHRYMSTRDEDLVDWRNRGTSHTTSHTTSHSTSPSTIRLNDGSNRHTSTSCSSSTNC